MVKKRIDNRIRVLIENGVATRQRSMFAVIGDKGKDQVVILHHMLSKAQIKSRPTVLWCYKKELGFSSHRKKRMKQIQKKLKYGKVDVNEDDPFELFIASTQIRYCYYNETHKILGNTYGMLVLQDFEALTPNLLARTIETIEGGGCVVILLRSVQSLKQLYTMTMDVHSRFRTESHQDIVARFNERFLLSLSDCKQCLVVDDQLNILPISSKTLNIESVGPQTQSKLSENELKLAEFKSNIDKTKPESELIKCCKTLDQAESLVKFINKITEKSFKSIATLTASRGRGKSATMGLAIASAIAYGYSNVFVTSPTPENLKTLFEFVFKGFDLLNYQEHVDYDIIQSTNPDFNQAIIRVNIFKEHRQTIQYINPKDASQLGQAELVCIDEAAAIPLPLVKNLINGPYLVFMSSTINGYEGTGRSLSLKLIQQLRQQSSNSLSNNGKIGGRMLLELELNESIRYANGDQIEKWLNELLCLNCCQLQQPSPTSSLILPKIRSSCPIPDACDLYYVNRDTLFSYHRVSEVFLQQLMSLYVASHYKNTPNDLQMLSDAPAHHIFCLLSPFDGKLTHLPEILCVIQVCLEGELSEESVDDGLKRGKRANGDLIPWTITQQFQDYDFAHLFGARIVRIATNPDYQSMGYGTRALKLLQQYYEGKIIDLSEDDDNKKKKSENLDGHDDDDDEAIDENNEKGDRMNIKGLSEEQLTLLTETIVPRKDLPPLLLKLNERKCEKLDYLGVSFGLTSDLLKFWKKSGFTPVYIRQTANDLTGEHSCIMLKELNRNTEDGEDDPSKSWLFQFFLDFRKRFTSLLGYEFRSFTPQLSINVLKQQIYPEAIKLQLNRETMSEYFSNYDIKRLEMYAQNLVDYHLIMDLVPQMAKLYFLNKLGSEFSLSLVQQAILIGLGLQFKSIDLLQTDLELQSNQLLALFNKVVKKLINLIEEINVSELGKEFKKVDETKYDHLKPLKETLDDELNKAAKQIIKQENEKVNKSKAFIDANLQQYAIKGSESEWNQALGKVNSGPSSSYITLKHINNNNDKRKLDYESHFDEKKLKKDDDVDNDDRKSNKKQNNKKKFNGNSNNKKNKKNFFIKNKK